MKKKQRQSQKKLQNKAATSAPEKPCAAPAGPDRLQLLLLAGILLLTCMAYLPALHSGFTNWDDHLHITQNSDIRSLCFENVRKICTSFYVGMYHPLTTLSFAVEFFLAGLNPRVFHGVNIALHLGNIILVYLFMNLLCRRSNIALCVAAFFALHPLHVESVAWVTERKDVLYSFFFLGSLISYYRYSKQKRGYGYFILSLGLFVCSLLSKSAAVTLPLFLILLDYYLARKPDAGAVLEKIPFFLLSLVFGIVGMASQKSAMSDISAMFSLFDRFFLVCHTILFYLIKLLFPYPLSAVYPYPEKINGLLPLDYYGAPVLLGLVVYGVFCAFKFRQGAFKKDILLGVMLFLVPLSLIVQIIPVGRQIAADRYTYIPSLGVFYLAAIGCAALFKSKKTGATVPAVFCVGLVLLCAVMTCKRVEIWHDSFTLWNTTLAQEPRASDAWYGRAIAKRDAGDLRGAIGDFNRAIKLDSFNDAYYYNRAVAVEQLGDADFAITDYDKALQLNPRHNRAYVNRGLLKQQKGKIQEAIADYDRAIKLDPNDTKALENKAAALTKTQSGTADALQAPSSRRAIEKQFLQAKALFEQKKYAEALEYLDVALLLNPGSADAYYYRGLARSAAGRPREGCEDLRKAEKAGHGQAGKARKENCKE